VIKEKNLKILALILVFLASYYMMNLSHQRYEKIDYEQEWSNNYFQDNKMTSHFIELHKEDLKKFASYEGGIFSKDSGYMKTIYKKKIPFSCGETAMAMDRGRLFFLKKDLVLKSKEYLFSEAQKCIKLILEDIDSKAKQQKENELKLKENELKFQEAIKVEFDPSKIH